MRTASIGKAEAATALGILESDLFRKASRAHAGSALKVSAVTMLRQRFVAGDIGEFSTADLLEVLYAPDLAPELAGFWLQFFPRVILSDRQEIRFDSVDLNEYRLAPFVAPNVQGRVMKSKGFEVKSFTPAYLKPKHVVDPTRAIPRQPGERPGGELSLSQRFDAIVADNLRRERASIENRWDWMACSAIVNGSVVVVGEDYPAVTVDFGRDASLTSTLAGAAKWDQTTATPIADLNVKRRASFNLGRAPTNRLIFGLDAWTAFSDSSHPDVQRLLDNMRRGNQSNFNAPGLSEGGPYEYQGQLSGFAGGGRLDMWTYNNLYEDATGAMVPYMDQGSVVGVTGSTEGIRCFGAIMDKQAQLRAMEMFPKQWDQEDPSVSYTMTQSAPLMVPLRPNTTWKLKVV